MRLGHVSEKGLIELVKQELLCGDRMERLKFCEHCVYGKACRAKFNAGQQRTKGTLDYVHADLWDPTKIPSHSGARYFLNIVDDYSRKFWIYIQKTKDEAFDNLRKTKQAERSRGFVLIMVLSYVLNLSMISVKRMALQGTGQLRAPLNKMV